MNLPQHFNWIPCAGKVPLIKWTEFTDRVASDEERKHWEASFPDAGRGIVCGPVSRIFVLDDDGSEELKKYHIPRTPMVKTPRGGKHHYFRWVDELNDKVTTKAGVLDKVDVRGQGGFVSFYGWSVSPTLMPFASPPQWLIDLLPNKTRTISEAPKGLAVLNTLKPGSRNNDFTSLAGSLRSRGYKVEEIFELLKSKAKEVDFSETELMSVCQSVGRYPITERKVEGQGESIDSFLANHVPVQWICEPFFAEQSIGFIGGLPESRKSWLMIDLAVECARGGGMWLKKFPVKGCKVLLIDQERSKAEVQRRLSAVIAEKDISSSDLKSALYVRCGTSTKIDLQHSYEALHKELSDIRPGLILVDSLATFHTREESNRMEIQQVLERIKQIRQEFNCAVILIHHETKGSYQNKKEGGAPSYLDLAGNVAIPAAAEVVLNVVKHDEDSSFVHHTKSTQGKKAAPFLVKVVDKNDDKSRIAIEAY